MRGVLEAVRPKPVIPSQVTGIRPAIGDIRNGLVLDLDFGRRYSSNTKVIDQSQNGNNGTIYGATWTAGRVGQALSFDGDDDYVDCGAGTSLDITDAITIEAWVKWGGSTGTFQSIVGKENAYTLYSNNNNKLDLWLYQGGWTKVTSTTTLTTNTWQHVTATYNGSSSGEIYLNGTSIKQSDVSGNIGISVYSLSIGDKSSVGFSFKGSIDEVRIYNRALSAEEIRQRYVYSNLQAGIII